jgi:hypothetical protein
MFGCIVNVHVHLTYIRSGSRLRQTQVQQLGSSQRLWAVVGRSRLLTRSGGRNDHGATICGLPDRREQVKDCDHF